MSAFIDGGETFWRDKMARPDQISFEHAVVIGDFGLGSDAPFILDYRTTAEHPVVRRLRWGSTVAENEWVIAAQDFDAMCEILAIPNPATK